MLCVLTQAEFQNKRAPVISVSNSCEVGKPFVCTKGSVDPTALTNEALHIFLRVFQELILLGTFLVPFVAHVLHWVTHFL